MSISDIYIPGKGPLNARIIIVGEAPSHEEVKLLEPFVGPSGRFLNSMLAEAGISRNQCWVTNVCKYFVPLAKDEKKKFSVRCSEVGIDLNKQIADLQTEIAQIRPNLIIALGSTALWALTGKSPIVKWRGSIINAFGFKCIATYHPAHILHQSGEVKGYWNKSVMAFDLKRCAEEAQFKEIKLPHRILSVAKSSADFYEFTRRNNNATKPAIDIEAQQCIPVCIGISFKPSEGITIPLWNHNGISDIPSADLANLWCALADFLSKHDVVGQNFGYDRDKLRRLGFIVKGLASDTLLKSFTLAPELPKNLAFNTSIYTKEPYYKDEGMYEGSINDLLIGCAKDACVTKEIDLLMDKDIDELGLRNYYEEFILPLHELFFYNEQLDAIEQVGFKVDESVRKDLITKYIQWDEDIRYKLYKLTNQYVNTSSPLQVAKLLYDDLKIPRRKGTGEEVLTQLINQIKNPVHQLILSLILEDRRVKKTLSSYLYSPADYDGRMRTSYYICLETGRSATQQQEPPIRPSIEYKGIDESGKKTKKKQYRGMAFQTITKHGDIGSDIRRMLVCDDGFIFIQADSSQAEARVIFKLANDEQALHDIDTHDYHALTASWFFGGTEDDYSKKKLGYESPIRFAGKTLRHAGHLGASKKRASIEVNTLARKNKIAFKITEQQAERALRIFHERQPKIREVFHNGVIECLKKDRSLRAPVPYGINGTIGGTRTFYERWDEELFRQAFSYIPQRTVSENTKAAGIRIRRIANWIRIIVEAHDALLFIVPIDRKIEAGEIIKAEFERPIDFSTCSLQRDKLVIPCELEEGFNYKDLGKFKSLEAV